MAKRVSKKINDEAAKELCSYTRKDLTASKIMELFGDFGEDGPRFQPYDIVTIPPKGYGNENTIRLW